MTAQQQQACCPEDIPPPPKTRDGWLRIAQKKSAEHMFGSMLPQVRSSGAPATYAALYPMRHGAAWLQEPDSCLKPSLQPGCTHRRSQGHHDLHRKVRPTAEHALSDAQSAHMQSAYDSTSRSMHHHCTHGCVSKLGMHRQTLWPHAMGRPSFKFIYDKKFDTCLYASWLHKCLATKLQMAQQQCMQLCPTLPRQAYMRLCTRNKRPACLMTQPADDSNNSMQATAAQAYL